MAKKIAPEDVSVTLRRDEWLDIMRALQIHTKDLKLTKNLYPDRRPSEFAMEISALKLTYENFLSSFVQNDPVSQKRMEAQIPAIVSKVAAKVFSRRKFKGSNTVTCAECHKEMREEEWEKHKQTHITTRQEPGEKE